MFLVQIFLGFILALGILWGSGRFLRGDSKKFFALTLVAAALIYVAFAALGLLNGSATPNWLFVELLGVGIYFIFAYFGLKVSSFFLSLGWILHVLWDVGPHMSESASFVPNFYPAVCIGFDLAFGFYLLHQFFSHFRE